jgi:hypothetical protein
MLGERYVVTKGDSLWRIAERKLGSGTQWTRIWKYNNRPEVSRVTGRTIPNPDLIYIGQVILIPVVPGMKQKPLPAGTPPSPHVEAQPENAPLPSSRIDLPQSRPTTLTTPQSQRPGVPQSTPQSQRPGAPQSRPSTPAPNGGGGTTLSDRLRHEMSPIAIKYKLNDLAFPPRDVGTAIIEVRMTGDVILMTKKQYPVTYVTSRGELELQVTREMNHAFGQLIEDCRFIYDPVKKQVTLRSMLVSQSNVPNSVSTAIGVEMNSSTLTPKLRAEIRLPKLQGSLAHYDYVAMDVKIVIEITPKYQPPAPPGNPSPRLDHIFAPGRVPTPVTGPFVMPRPATPAPAPVHLEPESGTNWKMVIGVGLVTFAGLVVVGTLVEDFFTAGAGVADDPASFALAGASFRQGMAMMARTAAVLPRARVPAAIQLRPSVSLRYGFAQ